MRALMKGNAAEFFQKKEKQVEDPELIMNQIQAKVIARYIGIDEQQISMYAGFFEQVTKIKLPKGFSRYPSTDKTKIHYVNQLTGDEDILHPSIDIIKMAFYKMLADSNSVATFNLKTKKLLPFVEDKMIKQCIGLSSKRRQAEKTNLQRDENGKIVMSKLARIKPDLKTLISTRSYMLKALVEKIYTKKQIWGKGKKAGVYAAVLAAERGNKSDQGDEQLQQTQDSLQFYEKIYVESKKFYQQRFGDLRYIPDELQKQRSFFRSTPESVLRNLGILNIEKTRMELYWLARLMECLPLPPGWSTKIGDTFDRFYYEPKKILFDLHPSYIYVLEQMGVFKQAYIEMDVIHQNYYNNMKEMVFFDYFERPYNVDLYAYVEKMNQFPMTKKKALKRSNQLSKNDWMALEGVKNSDLSINNAVLIENILEYWGTLNCKQDNYIPAISPFGEVVWSSTINERTINYCPHSLLLKNLVDQKSLSLPTINEEKDLKKNSTKNQKQYKQLIFQDLPEEREKFLQHYIRHDPQPLSQPYPVPINFAQNQYYDSIFISQFDLQSGLNLQSDTPLWLQKVHAKKNTDKYFAMLSKYPEKYEQIKSEFSQYTLEMIRKHEPNREQDIIRVITQINNIKDLKKLILHINDIDSREERKRLAAVGVVQEQEDSLGSSISQIDMDGEKEQDDESEDDLIQIDVDKSDSEGQKAESVESENEDNVKLPTQQSKGIQQVSEQSSQQQILPEKYPGVVYSKLKQIQELSEQELNKKLLALKKQKILKHKFSESTIKETVERISKELFNEKKASIELIDRKRNILISRFESEHAPYKTNPNKITHQEKQKRTSTAMNVGNASAQFSAFISQTSVLSNDEITDQIREIQAKNLKRREEENRENKQQKVVDQTRETIELMPIKRIKPDINDDPRLRHISQFGDLRQFSKSFGSPTKLKELKTQILKKDRNLLQDTSTTSKFNPEASLSSNYQNSKNNKLGKITKEKQFKQVEQAEEGNEQSNYGEGILKKSQSVLSLSNTSVSPNAMNRKFSRICLGNTATSLLSTDPLLRKGDLVILEARKSLISKGRGLQTFVSKKY